MKIIPTWHLRPRFMLWAGWILAAGLLIVIILERIAAALEA